MCNKMCPRCSVEKNVSEFYKNKKTKDGYRCYCKECEKKSNSANEQKYKETRKKYRKSDKFKEIKAEYYENNKEEILSGNKEWRMSTNGKFASYKRGAASRNIGWNLSSEEFKTFWQLPCYYCGDTIETIGIDRVDNEKPYQVDNCVSCCSICNYMKRDTTLSDFLEKIEKIHNIMEEKNENYSW